MDISNIANVLTGNMKSEYQVAQQQSVQQGNLYPLAQFYLSNEKELKGMYGLDLNRVLGIDDKTIALLGNIGIKNNIVNTTNETNTTTPSGIPQTTGNPSVEQNSIMEFVYPTIAILLASGGLFLLIKTLKNKKS